ncbi:MAG: YqgE/AlgH family protein [Deltaproteobacteria bacterium]|nr:YqgE/AlgH family protein [Deltaproteobacteria bacterium]
MTGTVKRLPDLRLIKGARRLIDGGGHIKGLIAVLAALLLVTLPTLCAEASVVRRTSLAPNIQKAPLPKRHQTLVRLARGKFLVAKRGMKDMRFAQTVILLLEYGSQGAGGLIINRPTPVAVSDVIKDINPGRLASGKVYIGGPVEPNTIVMLIRASKQPEGALHVFDNVYITSRKDTFDNAASDDRLAADCRLYAGYASWAPLQLDKEIFHGDWFVIDGDVRTVFEAGAEDIWPSLMRKLEP